MKQNKHMGTHITIYVYVTDAFDRGQVPMTGFLSVILFINGQMTNSFIQDIQSNKNYDVCCIFISGGGGWGGGVRYTII